jgi:hypothetical protein
MSHAKGQQTECPDEFTGGFKQGQTPRGPTDQAGWVQSAASRSAPARGHQAETGSYRHGVAAVNESLVGTTLIARMLTLITVNIGVGRRVTGPYSI